MGHAAYLVVCNTPRFLNYLRMMNKALNLDSALKITRTNLI